MKSFYNRMAALLHVFFLGIVALQAQSPQTFNYTGAEQTFTVPAGVTMVHVITFAATGGAGNSGSAVGAGGKGGKVEADLTVTPGQTLYIYVGGKGIQGGAGGFNGGGGTGLFFGNGISTSGGGGGATDIRIGGNALSNRVLVAGGGGGAGAYNTYTGGAGGGLTGGTGGGYTGGTGGTAAAGGNAGGALGLGGSGTNISGGGGGYYGGGSTSPYNGGGGGGSSYTDPTLCTNVTHTQGASDPDSHGSLVLSWTAPTYQPVVTSGSNGCSTVGTYNYTGDLNGKPRFAMGGNAIFWENNKWNIAYTGFTPFYYFFENTQNTPLPPCGLWANVEGCGGTQSVSGGGCAPTCTPPTVYALTGGGRSCDNGVSIVLEDSEFGVTYQLNNGLNPVGDHVEGTDEPLNFGDNFTEAGIYTVVATLTVGGCTADMTGSATITPCFYGLGTTYCSDDNTDYTLTGSEAPNGTFTGSGITDNGDGTATFNPSLAGSGGKVTYTVSSGDPIRPGQLTATTGSKSADPGGSTSTSQNVAVYLCGAPPSFTGLNAEYCDLDESVVLTGSYAPLGFFTGPGITDNGDGTATFDPGAAGLGGEVTYSLNENYEGAWIDISAGGFHTLAVKSDGSLWAWGRNESGQLGDGTMTNKNIPTRIGTEQDWQSVSAGAEYSLAIKADGTLWAWGENNRGQLGLGNNTNSSVPVQVGVDNDWSLVKAGGQHALALKTDGTLWGWGWNLLGQLGLGDDTNRNVPTLLSATPEWAVIAAGGAHCAAVKNDGTLWTWGYNFFGQVGNGTTNTEYTPVQIGNANNWAFVSTIGDFNTALRTDGTLWGWGINGSGGVGNGTEGANILAPVQEVTGATNWVACASGGGQSLAIKDDGTLWAWGDNQSGQLGNSNSGTYSNTPAQIGTDNDWYRVTAGYEFSLALKNNSVLYAAGDNEFGQVGNNNLDDQPIFKAVINSVSEPFPVNITRCPAFTALNAVYCGSDTEVILEGNYAPEGTFSGPGITDNGDGTASFDPAAAGTGGTITYTIGDTWTNASAGAYHAMAVQSNGSLWGWGYNEDYGQLGDGTFDDRYVPVLSGNGSNDWAKVSGGLYHSLGLKTDGTLWAWGYGEYGELGNGANDDSNVPVQVGIDNDWVFIKAGNLVSYGIKSNGTLWAWGYGGYDLFGDGTTDDRNTPVQIGTDTWAIVSNHSFDGFHTLGVKTNGTLWAWGSDNDEGQFGDGTTDASATPVQVGTDTDWVGADAGYSHSLGLKTDGTLWVWGNNEYGELGNGTTDDSLEPIQVGTETNWASATTGYNCSIATKTDGTLWGWGYNGDGELGNGTNDDSLEPLQSGTATNWASVTASLEGFALGLQTDGSLWSWGYQEYGELGDGQIDVSSNMPLRVGAPLVTFSKNVTVLTSPTELAISNISASDCKNTTCTTDDTYTADVTVTFNVQPLSGTVSLTGDDLVGAAPSVNASAINGTSYTFTGVTLRADGNDIDLTATLGDCSKNASLGEAPKCFFEPYVPSNIVVNASTCNFVTGTYVPNGTTNGAPAWINPTNNYYINWSGTGWVVGIFAVNSSGSITELPCTGWIGCGISLSGGCGSLEGTAITPPCSITDINIANATACNDNGTIDSNDDYFTADVTMTFAYAPENQNLVLYQDGNELASVSSDDLLCTTTWTFTGVQMPANGQDVVLTAEFVASNNKPAPGTATAARTDDVCTFTSDVLMTAPASCSCVPPTFTACPTNKTAFTSANACTAVVDYVATADGVPASVMTYALTGVTPGSGNGTGTGTAFNKGVTTVTLTATNDCGAPTCQFTVTVTDNVKPIITCPANRTVNADQGQCSSVQSYTVTTTDNCSASTQPTAGLSTGAAFPVGTTINAFLATDAAGNTATCSFSIRVLDTQLPVVTCPANTTLGIGTNCAAPLGSYGLANKSDNCSTAIFEAQSPVAGTIVTGHNTAQTVTLTATDGSGNTASCSFVVTLKDVMAPSITCPSNIIRPTDLNLCSAVVTYATPIYSDNCSGGGATHINGGTSGSTFDKGISTVNWQATDGVGLTKTCSFTITVNDAQAPTITCPANIVRSNDAGQCIAVVSYPTPKAADNCSLPAGQPQWVSGGTTPTASGANSSATFQKGATIVTWRATDGAGLTKTCTFRVTVNDTEAPTLTCPAPMSLTTAPNTCSSVATTYTNPTFTDNCALTNSTATRINGLASGSSFPLGNSNVVFQATDAAGNTRRCTMVITVTDNQPPVVTCPAAVVATGTGTPCRATAFYGSTTASDNCAGTLTPFLVTGLASGSQYPAGVTTNTFRAVAPNGQSSECSFTVTVDCGSGIGNNGVEVRNTNLSIQHSDKLELKLAPNPALSTVIVSIEGVGAGGGTLLVYDAVGRLVLRQVIVENQQTAAFQVDGSEFAPGMYRVNLRTASGMVTKTLVVVK